MAPACGFFVYQIAVSVASDGEIASGFSSYQIAVPVAPTSIVGDADGVAVTVMVGEGESCGLIAENIAMTRTAATINALTSRFFVFMA